MNDEQTKGAVIEISLLDLQRIGEHFCSQCRGRYTDELSEVLASNERDRLERAKKSAPTSKKPN